MLIVIEKTAHIWNYWKKFFVINDAPQLILAH